MAESEIPENPARPSWEIPRGIVAISSFVGFVIGVGGIAFSGNTDVPRAFFWVLQIFTLLSVAVFAGWVLDRVTREIGVCRYRWRHFEALYLSLTEERSTVSQLRTEVGQEKENVIILDRKLSQEQDRVALEQARVRYLGGLLVRRSAYDSSVAIFRLVDSLLVNDEIVVTLAEDGNPPLQPGDVLEVFDPGDGMWLAGLEVSNAKGPSERWIVTVTAWDSMFLTQLRTFAIKRDEVKTRARAFRYPVE